jgi:hypothetical protein
MVTTLANRAVFMRLAFETAIRSAPQVLHGSLELWWPAQHWHTTLSQHLSKRLRNGRGSRHRFISITSINSYRFTNRSLASIARSRCSVRVGWHARQNRPRRRDSATARWPPSRAANQTAPDSGSAFEAVSRGVPTSRRHGPPIDKTVTLDPRTPGWRRAASEQQNDEGRSSSAGQQQLPTIHRSSARANPHVRADDASCRSLGGRATTRHQPVIAARHVGGWRCVCTRSSGLLPGSLGLKG